MSPKRRAGFTLVEVLVAMILMVIVGGGIYRVMLAVQRTTRTQNERAMMQGALRTGVQLAISDLQEIYTYAGSGQSDMVTMNANLVGYRAMRGFGVTCQVTSTQILVRRSDYSGYQSIQAGRHGIVLFVEGADSTEDSDDSWERKGITGVGSATCPDGLTPALALTIPALSAPVANVFVPGPVRIYEDMELGSMTQGGRTWLGLRSVGSGEAMTVLAGPLQASGVAFTYWESPTAITTAPDQVRMIEMRLMGETDRGGNRGIRGTTELIQDTVRVRVQLRNSR